MSKLTVDNTQSRIAAVVDQDQDTSNLSTADYSLRLEYINMAQKEWAEISDWQALYAEFNSNISTSAGNASVALPNDFRKLASFPQIAQAESTNDSFPEVLPQNDKQYDENNNRVWILGNPQTGYVMRVHGTTLASGASYMVPYYRSPVSLVSPANISDMPSSDYLVQRTIAYIWESREDARFPQAKADADRILQNLLEFENVYNRASQYDRVKTVEETRHNFRIGRN